MCSAATGAARSGGAHSVQLLSESVQIVTTTHTKEKTRVERGLDFISE